MAECGYAPAIRRVEGVRLAAAADPVISRCQKLFPGVPAYQSAEALLAAEAVDALVLATPASAHLPDARLACAAGLPTLVEKPPAADAAAAVALAALDPAPWVGFNRRFDPRLRRLRAALPIGDRLDLRLDLHNRRGSWRSYAVRDDALLARGSHLIDLARWLTGSEIHRVRAAELGPESASLELELGNGHCARVSCGTGLFPRDHVEVRRVDGRRVARLKGKGNVRGALSRLVRPRAGDALVRLLSSEIEAFARAARGRPADPLATASDGLAVMAAIEATRRSAEENAWLAPSACGDRIDPQTIR